MTCRSAVSLALKFRDINHYKAYKLQRNIDNSSYLLSKYLGMFPGFLENFFPNFDSHSRMIYKRMSKQKLV